MATPVTRTLSRLRNNRDLRAEIMGLAAALATNRSSGRLTVLDPVVAEATVRAEWQRMLPALAPAVRQRMSLLVRTSAPGKAAPDAMQAPADTTPLDRPNYRYEVLRLLVAARLEAGPPARTQDLIQAIGASQTPVRQALDALRSAGVVHRASRRALEIHLEDISPELLARLGAQPQALRFRFERGAQVKPPAALLKRAQQLLQPPPGRTAWASLCLSGTPVAHQDVPGIDLMGVPRLDLVARVARHERVFHNRLLRLLDDGLEPEPNVLAAAPVVVTLVRADAAGVAKGAPAPGAVRRASPCDVFLSLVDLGLRAQAGQYARALRK
jgi:hypothetical protein